MQYNPHSQPYGAAMAQQPPPPSPPQQQAPQPQQAPYQSSYGYPQHQQPMHQHQQPMHPQGWGYGVNIPFQSPAAPPRRPHDTVSAARQLVAAVRSGTTASMQPPPPSQLQLFVPAPQPEPEPEPEPEGGYVDFGQNGGAPDYEPLLRTMSPPGGSGNYLGARRDVPLQPTISKLRDQMAVTVGAEMGAGAEAGLDAGGVDTYQTKRNAIMRSMSVSPPDPTEEPDDVVTWEWKDLVQVAKYNAKGVRVGSQQQYLVVDGDKEGGARLLFYRSLEDRLAERAPMRTLDAADLSSVIVSGVRVGYSKGSMRLRTAPRWLNGLTAARRVAMLKDSQELFQELCDYVKWRAANPVNHEVVPQPMVETSQHGTYNIGMLDCGEVLYKMDRADMKAEEEQEHITKLIRALLRLRQQEMRRDINFVGMLKHAEPKGTVRGNTGSYTERFVRVIEGQMAIYNNEAEMRQDAPRSMLGVDQIVAAYVDEVQLIMGDGSRPVTIEASRKLGSMDELDVLVPRLKTAAIRAAKLAAEAQQHVETDEFGNTWQEDTWHQHQHPQAGDVVYVDQLPDGEDYDSQGGHDAPLPDGWFDAWDDAEQQWYYYQIDENGNQINATWVHPGGAGGGGASEIPGSSAGGAVAGGTDANGAGAGEPTASRGNTASVGARVGGSSRPRPDVDGDDE